MQQTRFFFPMIFLLGEEAIPKRIGYTGSWPKTGAIHANTTITAVYTKDCDIIIPPQPTSPARSCPAGMANRSRRTFLLKMKLLPRRELTSPEHRLLPMNT